MKWLRRFGWMVLALLLLWAVAWLAVPPLLKSQAQSRLGALLGRSVTLGAVDFSPWSLELTVRDIVIGGAPVGATAGTTAGTTATAGVPLLKVARAYVNADIRSIVRRAPVIEAFELDAPQINLARTAPGRYDIDDLIARFTPDPNEKPATEPMRFAVYNLNVRDASVRFDDQPVRQRHRLEALQLTLPFLANLPAQIDVNVEPRLAFQFNGTPFDSGAQAKPFAQTREAALQLKMGQLDLVPYLAYLPSSLPVRLRQGSVSADVQMNFAMPTGGAPSVSLRGTVAAHNLVADDAASVPLLAFNRLTVALRDVRPLNRQLAFGAIDLDAPTLHVSRDAQGQVNLARLASPTGTPAAAPIPAPPPAASSKSADAAKPWQVQIDSLHLGAMRVLWSDASVAPAAALALQAVDVKAGPLAYPFASDASLPVRVQATLAAPGAAPSAAKATGATGPTNAGSTKADITSTTAQLGQFSAEGRVSDRMATLAVSLKDLTLDALAPYVGDALLAKISGSAAASATVQWAAGSAESTPTVLRIGSGELTVYNLRVADAGVGTAATAKAAAATPAIAISQLAVRGAEVDLTARAATIASLNVAQPLVAVSRDQAGVFNVQRWVKSGEPKPSAPKAGESTSGAPKSAAANADGNTADRTAAASNAAPNHATDAAVSSAWKLDLRDLAIDNGALRFDDAYVTGRADTAPVRTDLRALKLGMQNLALQGARTTAPAQIQLSARLLGMQDIELAADKKSALPRGAVGASSTGLVDWRGTLGLQPLAVRGALKLNRFPLHAFEPYVRDRLPVSVLRAEAGAKADVSVRELPAGLDVAVAGDLLLADVMVHSRAAAGGQKGLNATEELLSWQSFKLTGVKLALAPAKPPKIDIAEAALSDFYSRLVITEDGRFNLQDAGPAGAAANAAASAPATAPASATDSAASMLGSAVGSTVDAATSTAATAAASAMAVAKDLVPGLASAPAAATAPPAGAGPKGPPAFELYVGATKLANGKVDFTDRFVKPNYSADLTELNGTLGAFRSGTRDMATLDLHGRAAGTALLDISGQLNPTAEPLALNIRAKATDLELAPLSTYAAKYAGYAIERGKLSMDVSYAISADGKLDAKNQIILNQLTFGERVDSPTATKLPVLLAVSLLKDRNGVIDINLPISGSLNDPQFSVGGIIFKVIVNLITKALTAPFSLMFGGGGGPDMSQVGFNLGTPVFSESGAAAVDKVAKALLDRPSLKMTVSAAADPASEREAYVQAAIDARLLQEQKKEQARAGLSTPAAASGAASGSSAPAAPALGEAERNRLLKAVYAQTDIPNKPRNLIGMAKDLPPAEMQALLKTKIVVNDESMRQLALQRGTAVRDALIAKGLPSERLFIASPKVRGAGESAEPFTPSAKLSLAN
jgi:Domain of Unknown Function (DUF748)